MKKYQSDYRFSLASIVFKKTFLLQIDIYYPNHPKSRITIKDDSRLGCTSQEVVNWVDDLSKFSIDTQHTKKKTNVNIDVLVICNFFGVLAAGMLCLSYATVCVCVCVLPPDVTPHFFNCGKFTFQRKVALINGRSPSSRLNVTF